MMKRFCSIIFLLIFAASARSVLAQSTVGKVSGSMAQDMREFVETPAIPGYESALAAKIRERLSAFHPKTDNLDDVIVTLGSSGPVRLIVAPMDEPGYVVSNIT